MAGVRQTTLDFHSLLEEAERNQKVSEDLLSQRRVPAKPALPTRPSNLTHSRSPRPKSSQAHRTAATQPAPAVAKPPTPRNATQPVAARPPTSKNVVSKSTTVSKIHHGSKNGLTSNNVPVKSGTLKNAVSNSAAPRGITHKPVAFKSLAPVVPETRKSPSQASTATKRVDRPLTSYSDLMLLAKTNISSEPPLRKDPGKECAKPPEKVGSNNMKACRHDVVRAVRPKPAPPRNAIAVSSGKSVAVVKNSINRVVQPVRPRVGRVAPPVKPTAKAPPVKPTAKTQPVKPTANRMVQPVKPAVNRVAPHCPPPKVKPCQIPRRPTAPRTRPSTYDDEDEEDDDMDDFIVDDDECEEDPTKISATIRSLFKYNRNRRLDCDDDDDCMESSFNDIIKEEKRSARIGMLEDLEDMMREEKERQKRKKKN